MERTLLKDLEVGQNIHYKSLEKFDDYDDFTAHEFGISDTIGRSIIMLDHNDRDLTLTFMYDGYTENNGAIMKLIYKA